MKKETIIFPLCIFYNSRKRERKGEKEIFSCNWAIAIRASLYRPSINGTLINFYWQTSLPLVSSINWFFSFCTSGSMCLWNIEHRSSCPAVLRFSARKKSASICARAICQFYMCRNRRAGIIGNKSKRGKVHPDTIAANRLLSRLFAQTLRLVAYRPRRSFFCRFIRQFIRGIIGRSVKRFCTERTLKKTIFAIFRRRTLAESRAQLRIPGSFARYR